MPAEKRACIVDSISTTPMMIPGAISMPMPHEKTPMPKLVEELIPSETQMKVIQVIEQLAIKDMPFGLHDDGDWEEYI